jgi:hypothetical protein
LARTPVLPEATRVGALPAQSRRPRPWSATSAIRRFETPLNRLKCANSGRCRLRGELFKSTVSGVLVLAERQRGPRKSALGNMVCVEFCCSATFASTRLSGDSSGHFQRPSRCRAGRNPARPAAGLSIRAFEPHVRRRRVIAATESPVEVGEVGEAGVECDRGDRVVGETVVRQQPVRSAWRRSRTYSENVAPSLAKSFWTYRGVTP